MENVGLRINEIGSVCAWLYLYFLQAFIEQQLIPSVKGARASLNKYMTEGKNVQVQFLLSLYIVIHHLKLFHKNSVNRIEFTK